MALLVERTMMAEQQAESQQKQAQEKHGADDQQLCGWLFARMSFWYSLYWLAYDEETGHLNMYDRKDSTTPSK